MVLGGSFKYSSLRGPALSSLTHYAFATIGSESCTDTLLIVFSYPLKTSCFENSCLMSMQTGLGKNLLGTHLVSLPASESRVPPAFASDPLVHDSRERENTNSFEIIKEQCIPSSSMEKEENYPSLKLSLPDIVEIDGPSSLGNQFTADHESNFMKSVSSSVLNICLCSIFLGHKEI